MAALADLGREIGEIAEKVGPSVVGIGNRWRGGSGVVIGENRILTNAHNLHGEDTVMLSPIPEIFSACSRATSVPKRPASAPPSWRSAIRTATALESPSAS